MLTQARTFLILALGITLGASISMTHGVWADREAPRPIPLRDLQAFTDIMEQVREHYVEEVDDEELIQNAIRGMLEGLDPHSSYLDKQEYREFSISTTGKFGGLGIEVQMQNGFVRVVAPIDDTPADRAGIESGDLVIQIDEKPVKGMTLTEAVKLMRGKPGTDIELTILRSGVEQPFKVTITRDIIKVRSVRGRSLDEGFGYVRISTFNVGTGKALREQISELKEENDGNLKGLVLDLRNNPGGVLPAAVEVSNAFLHSGVIVSVKGRSSEASRDFKATPGDVMGRKPVVVLVNGGSASASEIVAGALQDHERGIIMGTKTFGKGSVQTLLPVQNSSAIKLTTARYYTPSGRSIQAEGVEPDIKIRQLEVKNRKPGVIGPIKEADLNNRLDNDQEQDKESAEKDEDEDDPGKLAETDYALYEALNLLRGLVIYQK